MPRFEEALYSYLVSNSEITALVDQRIYPLRLEEGCDLPAIAWQRVASDRTYTFDSFADTAAYTRARIQISCWARTALEAMDLGTAVLGALSGYNGDMAGTLIGSSTAVLEMDEYQSADRLYRRVMDFHITYEDDLSIPAS